MIAKKIFHIFILLFISIAIFIISGGIYYLISTEPNFETAYIIGTFVFSICMTLFLFIRARKKPIEYQRDVNCMMRIVNPLIVFTEILFILFVTFWWVLPYDIQIFYIATMCLILSYAYVFNELPTKRMAVIRTSIFKKRHLPALVIASCGYLLGLLIRVI